MDHHYHPEASFLLSVVALTILAIASGSYLWAVCRQRLTEKGWSNGRIAFSPPFVGWAHASLIGHAVQHLLIGMIAALGLVLAAAVTLLLRTLDVPRARQVTRVLRSVPAQFLTHPVTALVLNIGWM